MKPEQVIQYSKTEKATEISGDVELPTFFEYSAFRNAVAAIHQDAPDSSDARFFGQDPGVFRRAVDSLSKGKAPTKEEAGVYFTDVPHPFGIHELGEESFSTLLGHFGPDVLRAGFVCDNVARNNKTPLPVGGACLLDSYALHVLKNAAILTSEPEMTKKTAETFIANAPFYSQVTGAMLPGGGAGIGIMYLEVFPWYLQVMELGVGSAKEKTILAYERIYEAVGRRATLINPRFTVLGIQFEDLALEQDGYLEEWFYETVSALPNTFSSFKPNRYDPNGYLASWVRYTYNGPKILDVVKREVRKAHGISLDSFDIHVRTKQKDHFFNPTMLFTGGIGWKEAEFLSRYANIAALGIDHWQLTKRPDTNGFLGFDDFTIDGELVHKTVNLASSKKRMPETLEELSEVLSSPVRLHGGNIEEHILCLRLSAASGMPQERLAAEVLRKSGNVFSIEQGIEDKKSEIATLEALQAFFSKEEISQEQIFSESVVFGILSKATRTKSVQKIIRNEEIDIDTLTRHLVRRVIEKDYQKNMLEDSTKEKDLFFSICTELERLEEKAKISLLSMQKKYDAMKQELEDIISGVSGGILADYEISLVPALPVLPLYKNLIISHAIQMSFDPDMREFVCDAAWIARLELEESVKMEMISTQCQLILPKIESYLRFILHGGDYPESRFVRTYMPIRER